MRKMCPNCVNYTNGKIGGKHECQHPMCDCAGGVHGKDHVEILPPLNPGSENWKVAAAHGSRS